jgi:hypothetical protein
MPPFWFDQHFGKTSPYSTPLGANHSDTYAMQTAATTPSHWVNLALPLGTHRQALGRRSMSVACSDLRVHLTAMVQPPRMSTPTEVLACLVRADAVAVQEQHDLADNLLLGPASDDPPRSLRADTGHLTQTTRLLLDDLGRLWRAR